MDVMIDIETLGKTSQAALIQLAAIIFDRNTGEEIDTFKAEVDPTSSVEIGMTLNVDTIMWWLQQSKDAQKSITKQPRGSISEVMVNFSRWIKKHESNPKNVLVWSHATFDFPILENVYRLLKMEAPWYYRSARDLRTLVDLADINVYNEYKRKGVAHDALDDCRFQIQYTVDALNKVKEMVVA